MLTIPNIMQYFVKTAQVIESQHVYAMPDYDKYREVECRPCMHRRICQALHTRDLYNQRWPCVITHSSFNINSLNDAGALYFEECY